MRVQAHAGHRLALCGVGSDKLPGGLEVLGHGAPVGGDTAFSMGDGCAMRGAEQGVLAAAAVEQKGPVKRGRAADEKKGKPQRKPRGS